MHHLRQCRSENIFSQTFGNSENEKDESVPLGGQFASAGVSDYSDCSVDSSDSDEYDFDFDEFDVQPFFEVPTRPDPQDSPCYADVTVQIMHNEEPDYWIQPGSIERMNGSKIRELRLLLGEWLFRLSWTYPTTTEALFQCVSMFDRLLGRRSIPFNKLQLMCCCCLWISVKVEMHAEECLTPLFQYCHNKFTRADFLRAEGEILSAIDYKINTVSACYFLKRFLEAVNADERVNLIASFLCECSLLFVELSCYKRSLVAYCATAAACLLFGCGEKMSALSCFLRNFAREDVQKCMAVMLHAGKTIAGKKKHGPFRKYASKTVAGVSRGGAALIESVDFGADLVRAMDSLLG